MPSTLHEGLVTLFLDDPALTVRLVEAIDGRVLTARATRILAVGSVAELLAD